MSGNEFRDAVVDKASKLVLLLTNGDSLGSIKSTKEIKKVLNDVRILTTEALDNPNLLTGENKRSR